MLFGYLTLFTALILSLSAAVYSILGLTAIFAAAFWTIVVIAIVLLLIRTINLQRRVDRLENRLITAERDYNLSVNNWKSK